MVGISYALADFRTGGPILDLPTRAGATWAAQLNRADTLSCDVNMRDPDALALDLRAASEPKKTVLLARTDDDDILAWGLIDDDRVWNEDDQTLTLSAKGVWSSFFGVGLIGPSTALTYDLTDWQGVPNPALDTFFGPGLSLGTIGKKYVEQRLTWPGSPTFTLPADSPGGHYDGETFLALKTVGSKLTDLTNREGGPDFAFEAGRAPDGLSLEYIMRHGTEASPSIGRDVGSWGLGGDSPITKLQVKDSAAEMATAAWGLAGRGADAVLASRVLNSDMVNLDGYPPMDYVNTSRSSIVEQTTLDEYTAQDALYARGTFRSLSFSVRGDSFPRLGQYRPGDYATLTVPTGHPWLTDDIVICITSISGDETGKEIKIGCVVL